MFKFFVFLKKLFQRNADPDLETPTVVGVLPNIPGGEDNLLPKDAWLQPLRIEFELWSDPAPREENVDTVELIWDNDLDNPVDVRQYAGPIDPENPPQLWLQVPVAELDEGAHRLHYRLHPWNGGNARTSPMVNVTIDKTPVDLAFANTPLIDPIIIDTGLSEEYLLEHNGVVTVTIPTYLEPAPGDRIVAIWTNEDSGQFREVPRTLTRDDYEDVPLQLAFDEQLIRDMGDGERSISYRVFDRAGNESRLSESVSFTVAVLRAPHFVPYPWIVEAEGNPSQYGDLDPMQAQRGATARIPAEAVYYDDDVVHMQFGEPGTAGAVAVPVPWGVKEVPIPAASVAAMFDKSVPVYYQVVLADDTIKESEYLTLRVQSIPSHRFPVPQLEAPFTDPVSKASIPSTGLPVHQRKWTFISELCLITVEVSGLGAGGPVSRVVLDRHQVEPAQVEDGVHVKLPRDFMLTLNDDAPFTVQTQVSFDDGERWVNFSTLRPTLKA